MAFFILLLIGGFVLLLSLGYRGLRDGIGDSAAFGAVCVSLATVLGCLLAIAFYAETF